MSCNNVHCPCPCLHLMKSQRLLLSLCFSGRSGKIWPPWPLIFWDICDFSSKIAEQNSTKLDRMQDLNVLYQVCVFRADRKTRWPPWPLIGWDIFEFSFKPLNGIKGNLTGSKIFMSSTPSLCFLGRPENQDGRPGLWLAETFSTSPLKPLNGIKRNLTGSKISTNFVCFFWGGGIIGKRRWPPRHLIGWDIFAFFSETAINGIHRNLTGIKILMPLPSLCLGRSEKQDGRPGL